MHHQPPTTIQQNLAPQNTNVFPSAQPTAIINRPVLENRTVNQSDNVHSFLQNYDPTRTLQVPNPPRIPKSDVPLFISGRKTRRLHNPVISQRRNYSAEWAACHPEIIEDFFVKHPRKHGLSNRSSSGGNIARIRTLKENVKDKKEKTIRHKSTVIKDRPPKNREFDWRPSESTVSPMPASRIPEPIPRAASPLKQLAESPPNSVKEDPIAEMKEMIPKPPEYMRVVGELREMIDKRKNTPGNDANSVVPSSMNLTQRKKPSPQLDTTTTIKAANLVTPYDNINYTNPSFRLKHVTPPRSPKYGRVLNNQTPIAKPTIAKRAQNSFSGYSLETLPDEEDLIDRINEMNVENGNSKTFVASDGTQWEVIVIGAEDDEMRTVDKILMDEKMAWDAANQRSRSQIPEKEIDLFV